MSGSTGQDAAELTFPSRPRRRLWLVIALAAAGAALLAMVQGQAPPDPLMAEPLVEPVAASSPGDTAADDPATEDLAPGDGAPDEVASEATTPQPAADSVELDPLADAPLTPLLGSVDGLVLYAPAGDLVVVGFHEASSPSFAIEPIGSLVSNENTTRFEAIPDRPDGVAYHVLSSRGRIHPPTSAVDVVLVDEVPVLAPVTGVVADIREYHLYGRHLDHRVEIHPTAAPHLRIVLVHVDDIQVSVGDQVTAGISVLAGTANRFPFASQIDRETEPDRWPHVHLEVQPIDAPRPGDEVEPDGAPDEPSQE